MTVVCGGGSNGGDGRIAALVLGDAGLDVRVVEAPREDEADAPELGAPDVVVDALFGTGFSGTPRAAAARLDRGDERARRPVVAVDVPSGVDASTRSRRRSGRARRRDGHVRGPEGRAARRAGALPLRRGDRRPDIGLDARARRRCAARVPALLREVPLRAAEANKYSAGAVVVVGGSPGMTGAVCLAAEAALRADAGYVSVVAPASSTPILEVRLLEPVKRAAPEDADGLLVPEALELVVEQAKRARAVVLGPGIGRSDGVQALVRELLQTLEIPVVVDADALAGLAPEPWRAPVVLTPHSGELARLLGTDSFRVEAQRLEAVRACAERFGCVALLKGADTLVADAGGRVVVADHGPPSLATAGTGDVLSGDRRRVPREGDGARARGRGRGDGARPRRAARAAPARPRRERPARAAPGRPGRPGLARTGHADA